MGHSHRLGTRREGLGPEEDQTRHAATHDHEQCVCVCVCVCVFVVMCDCMSCLVLLRPHSIACTTCKTLNACGVPN